MVRIDKYQGHAKKELEAMGISDALPLLTSRCRRAIKRAEAGKNPILKRFIRRVAKIKAANPKKIIRTHIRDAPILPSWLDLTFAVHNGKEFKNVLITIDKLGFRLGDFAHTTGRVLHSGPGIGATRGSKFIPLK